MSLTVFMGSDMSRGARTMDDPGVICQVKQPTCVFVFLYVHSLVPLLVLNGFRIFGEAAIFCKGPLERLSVP